MPIKTLDTNVYEESVDRVKRLYRNGDRLVVSFSGGKDSTAVMEVCLEAARQMNRLPLDIVMRDDEIMFPGTFEFAERVAKRSDVRFTWLIFNQPVANVFNREEPFFWVFDKRLKPEQWVRQPPDFATYADEKSIVHMTVPMRFPVRRGQRLISVQGVRASESLNRRRSIFSSEGYITKAPNDFGVYNAKPIYDWKDGDVWKAIQDNHWDYNDAYDGMARIGLPKHQLRITPPTITILNVPMIRAAAKLWPRWFDKVCIRAPGVRIVSTFGLTALRPKRDLGQSWEEVYAIECIEKAPTWIADRSKYLREVVLARHARHSTHPYPDVVPCPLCRPLGCWKQLADVMFTGDPFSLKTKGFVPLVEPSFFRKPLPQTSRVAK